MINLPPQSMPIHIDQIEQNQCQEENIVDCVYKQIGNDLSLIDGSLSYGKIYKAMNEVTSEIVAIKEIQFDNSNNNTNNTNNANRVNNSSKSLIQNEIETLKILNDTQNDPSNHNILKYIDSFSNSESVSLVIEYCPGGNLLNYINTVGALDESLAGKIFEQILEAINFCHNVKFIAHRDLKPENILITALPNVKLADFGMSVSVSCDTNDSENNRILCTSYGGSVFYSAPEILCKIPFDPIMADIWSLGVILYVMISGTLPWYIDNKNRNGSFNTSVFHDSSIMMSSVQNKQVMKQIMAGSIQPLPETISLDCKKLILSMLQINPKRRPSIEQIMESEWVQRTKKMKLIMPDESQTRQSLIESLPMLHNRKQSKAINYSFSSTLHSIKAGAFKDLNHRAKISSNPNSKSSSISNLNKGIRLPSRKVPSVNAFVGKKSKPNKSYLTCSSFVNK